MRIYRTVWLFFCGVVGALGAVVAFTWSFGTVIMVFILAALLGAGAALVALDPEGTDRLPRDNRRIVITSSVLSGTGTVALVGWGMALGAPTALLLLAITAGGSPYAIRYGLQWLRQHGHLAEPSSRPAPPDPGERSPGSLPAPVSGIAPDQPAQPEVAPASLSDEALCLAWRTSFSALQRASSPTQRLQIVDGRRAYLDEIERRTAHGMAAWLASGPRAAGDPSRFVLGDGAAGRAPIDWDGLLHDTDK
ncbi:hypothetical protein OHB24_21035 [Kribbella sp. NBC_00482]|uniref:hypothetical protein n=1 Tax=Kribbella sp. NBC_00482 TaxID=2975968 RepID=UPI002E17399C